jgi:hypothetical protein
VILNWNSGEEVMIVEPVDLRQWLDDFRFVKGIGQVSKGVVRP